MSLDPELTLTGADLYAWTDYRRHLRTERKSPRTIQCYGEALAQLAQFIAPLPVLEATKRELCDYLIWCGDTKSDATALARYRSLSAAYGWFEAEDILEVNPMRKVPKPGTDQKTPEVLDRAELTALVKACRPKAGATAFDKALAVRDEAIISLWCEAGSPRVSEMAGITLADVNLSRDEVLVHGKGGKPRFVPMSPETARAFSRWFRLRASLPTAARSDKAFVGKRGDLSARGLAEMLDDRAGKAGIGHVHPHQLRHSAYHWFRMDGGNVDDAMRLFGWSDISMALVYGRGAAAARSVQTGRDMALRSRLAA